MRKFTGIGAAMALAMLASSSASAETIYGLTNLQQLVTFDSVTRTVTNTVSLSGFSIGGEILTTIDVRPATGQIFGLSNQSNLYIIDAATGNRTQVGSGPLSTVPAGAAAIDFNPTVDRIRVVSSGGTNLRVNPNDGAVTVDSPLAYAAGDPNAGDSPQIVTAGYTNSFAGATTTTLYTVDAFNDTLNTQIPPNNGTQNTVGLLGFDIAASGGFTGFDISGSTGLAYLTGNNLVGGGLVANTLYGVNLATGAASVLGAVSGVNGTFRDIAVVPEPATLSLLGLAGLALIRRR